MTDFTPLSGTRIHPLLLIDDDRSLASLISEYCGGGGFSVVSAQNGEEGLRLTRQQPFTLIILDVMLPGANGFEVLERLRRVTDTPVLMLTTRGASKDRIRGLEAGADDYLPKPFQPEELLARIRSILRRSRTDRHAPARVTIGDLTLDDQERSVVLGNSRIQVTGAEFHLLKLLLNQPGEPLTREELIPVIFNREPHSFDRSIDNLINNLRKKLGLHEDGTERIKSIRNVGYCYVVSPEGQINS